MKPRIRKKSLKDYFKEIDKLVDKYNLSAWEVATLNLSAIVSFHKISYNKTKKELLKKKDATKNT